MKILAISGGSPNGNNDAMAREALMGAKEEGAEIEFIHLLDLDMKPCTGCVACVNSMMRGGAGDCPIKDDMNWLDEKIMQADGLLFVSPVFEKGMPAVTHLVQDRIFGPAHDPGPVFIASKIAEKTGGTGPDMRKMKPKVISFISIGGSDWTTRMAADMSLLAMSRAYKVIDNEVFNWSKGIIMNDESVAKCRQVGVNLAKAAAMGAENAKYLGDPGVCPECNSRNFHVKDDPKDTICTACGLVGELKLVDGKMFFEIPEDSFVHSHFRMSGKMEHMDDMKRVETELNEFKKMPEYNERKAKYKAFISPTKPQ